MKSKENKKGIFILDMIVVIVILLIFAFSIIFGYMLLTNVSDSFNADADMSAEAIATLNNYKTNYPSSFDSAFLMAIILLWVFFLISAFFIDSNPIFFVIFLILIIFVLITSIVINNVWYESMQDPDLSIFESSFPIISWYFSNILTVWIIIGFSTLISFFAKGRVNQGGF
jgi:hypothetical protein